MTVAVDVTESRTSWRTTREKVLLGAQLANTAKIVNRDKEAARTQVKGRAAWSQTKVQINMASQISHLARDAHAEHCRREAELAKTKAEEARERRRKAMVGWKGVHSALVLGAQIQHEAARLQTEKAKIAEEEAAAERQAYAGRAGWSQLHRQVGAAGHVAEAARQAEARKLKADREAAERAQEEARQVELRLQRVEMAALEAEVARAEQRARETAEAAEARQRMEAAEAAQDEAERRAQLRALGSARWGQLGHNLLAETLVSHASLATEAAKALKAQRNGNDANFLAYLKIHAANHDRLRIRTSSGQLSYNGFREVAGTTAFYSRQSSPR